MATARRQRSPPRVIDLISDDEDDSVPPPRVAAAKPDPVSSEQNGRYEFFGEEAVWIPDDSPPEVSAAARLPSPRIKSPTPEQHGYVQFVKEETVFTSDLCLQQVLDVFPNVSHEHVLKLFDELGQGVPPMPGADRYENIVNKLIEAESYPKQGKGKQPELKRKPEDDLKQDDLKRWEGGDRRPALAALKGPIAAALKADFPVMTNQVIKQEITKHKHLFHTYVALAALRDAKQTGWTGRPATMPASADTILLNTGVPELYDELQAARRRVSFIRSERTIALAKRQAEDENLKRAMEAGETAECQACFDDLPMNRQIHCNGDTAHFTCFGCITTYVESEVGQSRCGVMCTAGCGAGYARAQLHLLDDKQLLEKLEQLQQEKDIRDADLVDLEECPFCDYKAILPPIEEDFEFRCANTDCEQVSCRRCKAASHIPKSCEEHAKDHKLDSRHKIEEAMTEALIRKCGKCSKPFIKDFGCNKMSCPSCGNLQCYCCSATVKDYNHFNQTANGGPNPSSAGSSDKRCPLYDNVEERHKREIEEAEAKARAEAMEANPDISEDDLVIKESDAVRMATQARLRQAGGANVAHGHAHGLNLNPYGVLDFGAGHYYDADFVEDDDDPLMRQPAALERLAQQQRDRIARLARERLNAMRERLEQGRVERQAARQQAMRERSANRAAPVPPGRGARTVQNPIRRGPLGHGLGGHIAGHGVQTHLAQPQPMYRGLAHPHPHQAPQMGLHDNMIGYMPIYGMQMPGIGRFPPPQAPAPVPRANMANRANPFGNVHAALGDVPPGGYGNVLGVVGGTPAAPQPGANPGPGTGRVLGARNNGSEGQQGLFDAFVEDSFGGGDADPFGFGRIIGGEHAPPRFPEMLAPGQPRNHALGRNAHPELRGQHDALAYRAGQEGQRQALQNMENRAGGNGDVYELDRADPRRYHRIGAAFPGAPHAG